MKTKTIRYLIESMALSLIMGVIKLLPIRTASNIFGGLARKVGPHLKVSQVAEKNISNAMPEVSAEERKKIIKAMWENLGRTIAEFPHLGGLSDQEFDKYVRVEGIEHIKKMYDENKGGILVSGHIANWEIMPKTLKRMGIPIALVYRPANNPYVDAKIKKLRGVYQEDQIPKGKEGAIQMIRVLKEGKILGALVDQKMNNGIEVKLFGHKAMTASAIPKVAIRSNYEVIPVQMIRDRKNPHAFIMKIDPPISLEKTGIQQSDDPIKQLTQEINNIMEEWIREYPEQWFWVHKRWKWEE